MRVGICLEAAFVDLCLLLQHGTSITYVYISFPHHYIHEWKLVLRVCSSAPIVGRGVIHKGKVCAKEHVYQISAKEDHCGSRKVQIVVSLIRWAVCGE